MKNTNLQSFRVVGVREELFVDSVTNLDYESTDVIAKQHIILLVNEYGAKFEATLSESSGPCGSGYSMSRWGHYKIEPVSEFLGVTHRPMYKNSPKYSIELEFPMKYNFMSYSEDIFNDIFTVSYHGGDRLYPRGYYTIDLELFLPIDGRYKTKRPVWLFYGDSAMGKSYLSSMTGKTKYETDKSENLPKSITADIVVIGNKYKFTIEQISEKLFGDCEIIPVKFG